MNAFPQLATGATAQFPIRRERRFRTLGEPLADGSEIRVSDVDFEERTWELSLADLTDAEWQNVADLFTAVEGRLQTFVFLEPGANLLAWSEDFDEAAWQSSGVTLVGGGTDPLGGTGAVQVSGAGEFWQAVVGPAAFRYVASAWVRSSVAGVELKITDGAASQVAVAVDSNGQWRRYEVTSSFSSASQEVRWLLNKPSGAAVDVFGPQLEAQISASAYKSTKQQAGAYSNARFDQDALADQQTAKGLHAGLVRIIWTPSQT